MRSLCLLCILAARLSAQPTADLILHNAKVVTVDDHSTIAQAVVIRGDRIIAVGGEDLLQKYRAQTILDLKGKSVQPGFVDTHIHIRGEPENLPTDSESPQSARRLFSSRPAHARFSRVSARVAAFCRSLFLRS